MNAAHAGDLLAQLQQVPVPAEFMDGHSFSAMLADASLGVLAIDGKTLCSTLAEHSRCYQRKRLPSRPTTR